MVNMAVNTYPYIKDNVLNDKISYSYSEFQGIDFIINWKKTRLSYIGKRDHNFKVDPEHIASHIYCNSIQKNATEKLFNKWILSLIENKYNAKDITLLLKRFEVTKRIYSSYDSEFRPCDRQDFQNLILYLKFGCVLTLCYKNTNRIQYLNSLLKMIDIICSMFNQLDSKEKEILSWLIENEIEFVESLMKRHNIIIH